MEVAVKIIEGWPSVAKDGQVSRTKSAKYSVSHMRQCDGYTD